MSDSWVGLKAEVRLVQVDKYDSGMSRFVRIEGVRDGLICMSNADADGPKDALEWIPLSRVASVRIMTDEAIAAAAEKRKAEYAAYLNRAYEEHEQKEAEAAVWAERHPIRMWFIRRGLMNPTRPDWHASPPG